MYSKLETLAQCMPPPRHVLAVSRYQSRHLANRFEISTSLIITTSAIWRIIMNEWLDVAVEPLSVSPNSDVSGKQSLYPDGDPDHHQNLNICSLTHWQPSPKISCKSVRKFLLTLLRRKHNLLGGGNNTGRSVTRRRTIHGQSVACRSSHLT